MKNNWPSKEVQNLSCHKEYTLKFPKISHLQILGLAMYVFLYKKNIKSSSKNTVDYNSYKIYWVNLKENIKIFHMKNHCIFEK